MILSIQYLRGIAAFLVLMHHVAFKLERYGNNPLSWLHSADVGVDIFFVISGFIMCHSVRHKHQQEGAVGDFLRGRVARIIPLYWLLTTVALAVFIVAPRVVNSSGGQTLIGASYLLLPTEGKYLVQNGWTLSYEFYFYLLFCIGVALPKVAGRWVVVALISTLVTLGLALDAKGVWIDFLLSPMLAEFGFGMLLYMAFERPWRISGTVSTALAAIAVAGWLVVNFSRPAGAPGIENAERVLAYGLPSLLLCFALVCRAGQAEFRERRALRWLGDASYSLYLSHPFVAAALTLALSRVLPASVAQWVVGPAIVAVSLLVAGFLYAKVESPMVDKARTLLGHRH